jgi:hypothetical protein
MFNRCSRFSSLIFPPTVYDEHVLLPLLLGKEQLILSVAHVNASWNTSKRARVHEFASLTPATCTLYFSRNRILSTPGFGDVISRERFEEIMKFLHFAENIEKANYEGLAKLLHKVFPVLSHLNYKFQNLFLPGQNISVDEKPICLSNSIYH